MATLLKIYRTDKSQNTSWLLSLLIVTSILDTIWSFNNTILLLIEYDERLAIDSFRLFIRWRYILRHHNLATKSSSILQLFESKNVHYAIIHTELSQIIFQHSYSFLEKKSGYGTLASIHECRFSEKTVSDWKTLLYITFYGRLFCKFLQNFSGKKMLTRPFYTFDKNIFEFRSIAM